MHHSFFAIALTLFILLPHVAKAAPVTVGFEVLVEGRGADGPDNVLENQVQVGDTISGTFTVESNSLVPLNGDPLFEIYGGLDLEITLQLGSLSFATHTPLRFHDEEIVVGLVSCCGIDRHVYEIYWQDDFDDQFNTSGTLDVDTVDLFDFSILLSDSTGTALTDDAALPLPSLAGFDGRDFRASGVLVGSTERFSISGVLTSMAIVPEPSTALLFGIGLAGLARGRSARRTVVP